jgi:hypothetical protein
LADAGILQAHRLRPRHWRVLRAFTEQEPEPFTIGGATGAQRPARLQLNADQAPVDILQELAQLGLIRKQSELDPQHSRRVLRHVWLISPHMLQTLREAVDMLSEDNADNTFFADSPDGHARRLERTRRFEDYPGRERGRTRLPPGAADEARSFYAALRHRVDRDARILHLGRDGDPDRDRLRKSKARTPQLALVQTAPASEGQSEDSRMAPREALVLSDEQWQVLRIAIDDLDGELSINRLFDGVKHQGVSISRHRLIDFGQQLETLGWVTADEGSSGRRCTDALIDQVAQHFQGNGTQERVFSPVPGNDPGTEWNARNGR